MKRFKQIGVDDLLKRMPKGIVLIDGGDGWAWLDDYIREGIGGNMVLVDDSDSVEAAPEIVPAKKPKAPEVVAEKSPEDALFEKIEQMGRPDPAKIADIYKAGKGIGKISQELKISAPEIKKILKEQGVPLRINRQFYPNIIQAAKDGMNVDLIAKRFDTCPEYVQAVLDGKGGKQ